MTEAFHIPKLKTDEGSLLVDNILEATVDAAALLDRDLKVTYLTEGFTQLTGQSQKEYVGRPARELKISPLSYLEQVCSTGQRRMGLTMQIGGQNLMVNLVPVIWDHEVTGVVLLIPFRSMAVLKRAIEEQEKLYPVAPPSPKRRNVYSFSDYIGDSPEILNLIEQCHRIAHSPHPVLLIGETGVGKEVLSGGIYREYCGGKNLPYIRINCSAIPRELLESELFGHEKGAFTGANSVQKGKFEQAAGGVLLLDEIGEMDLSLQSKLLRVLEEREFERIGGTRVIPLTAKIIASTNENIKQMAAEKRFRMDLYYRLNTFEINIPPLRAHKQDIPKLIEHFQRQDNLKLEFTEDAMNMLFHYSWPGNVRELRNVLNRLYFLYPNTVIDQKHIYDATGEMFHLVKLEEYRGMDDPMPPPTMAQAKYDAEGQLVEQGTKPKEKTGEHRQQGELHSLQEVEMEHIKSVLAQTDTCSHAAKILGISRSTLYEKMKKYGIDG